MVAIKNWFLQKNDLNWMRRFKLEIVKETEKAVLVKVADRSLSFHGETYWIPKSCLIDEWEKDTSNFAYHDYLVDVVNEAYVNGTLQNKRFQSGRNTYDMTSFTHQYTTKSLIAFLEKNNIEFMNKEEWKNR